MGRNAPIVRRFDPIGQPFKPATRSLGGQTHMLVIAMDYKGTSNPLTCTIDAKNMIALAQASGITSIKALWDSQCTKQNVLQQLVNVANICQPGDTFFFYYTGHGTSVKDLDGDEVDFKDEAYVCVTSTGQISADEFLTDDEFSAHLLEYCGKEVNIIIVSDCCHSGTMCDFGKRGWTGYNAISISGCRDSQTSGDTGKGGICTHSMLMAIESLLKKGKTSFSVGQLYRETLAFDDSKFASPQDIFLDTAPQTSSNSIQWPLVPKGQFQAPYSMPGGLLPGAQAISTSQSTFTAGAATPGAPPPVAAVAAQPATFIGGQGLTQSFLPPLPTYVPQQILQPHKPSVTSSFPSSFSTFSSGYPGGSSFSNLGTASPAPGGFAALGGPSSYLSLLQSLSSPMSRDLGGMPLTPTYPGMPPQIAYAMPAGATREIVYAAPVAQSYAVPATTTYVQAPMASAAPMAAPVMYYSG